MTRAAGSAPRPPDRRGTVGRTRVEPPVLWPARSRFAFTIFDDTDLTTLTNGRPVYDLLTDLGLRTTKSVWTLAPDGRGRVGGQTCEDPDYRRWVTSVQDAGHEIGFHNATDEPSTRDRTILALDRFRELFGHDPRVGADHSGNLEAMYWGPHRLSGVRARLYAGFERTLRPHRRQGTGHVPTSPYFWGDVLRDRVDYWRNFTFAAIDVLDPCPVLPYHDPRRPYVPWWFASTHAPTASALVEALSPERLDELEASGRACILYTHLGAGAAPRWGARPTRAVGVRGPGVPSRLVRPGVRGARPPAVGGAGWPPRRRSPAPHGVALDRRSDPGTGRARAATPPAGLSAVARPGSAAAEDDALEDGPVAPESAPRCRVGHRPAHDAVALPGDAVGRGDRDGSEPQLVLVERGRCGALAQQAEVVGAKATSLADRHRGSLQAVSGVQDHGRVVLEPRVDVVPLGPHQGDDGRGHHLVVLAQPEDDDVPGGDPLLEEGSRRGPRPDPPEPLAPGRGADRVVGLAQVGGAGERPDGATPRPPARRSPRVEWRPATTSSKVLSASGTTASTGPGIV